MRLSFSIAFLSVSLSACSLWPASGPALPDGKSRHPVNTPQAIAEFMRGHAASSETTPVVSLPASDRVDISLAQMLELYIPSNYQVFPGPGVRLDRRLSYDRGLKWREAVSAALSGVEMSANIDTERHKIFINTR